MWCNDCLRVAIVVLFALVVMRQLIKPEVYERNEFLRIVNSASKDQQRAFMIYLQSSMPHVHWKNCREVILPVCIDVIATKHSAAEFCMDLVGYCRRYEPDTYSTPDYR